MNFERARSLESLNVKQLLSSYPARNTRNIVITTMGVLFVCAVIFLPELLPYGAKKDQTKGLEPVPANVGSSLLTSLERASLKYESPEEIEKDVSTSIVPRPKIASAPEDGTNLSIGDRFRGYSLSPAQHQAILEQAKQQTVQFAKSLGLESIQTKFALIDFRNAVAFIQAGTKDALTGNQSIRYILAARDKVVDAIQKDGVPSELYRNWNLSSISAIEAIEVLRGEIEAQGPDREKIVENSKIVPDKRLKRRIAPVPVNMDEVKIVPERAVLLLRGSVRTKLPIKLIELFREDGSRAAHVTLKNFDKDGHNFVAKIHNYPGRLLFRFIFLNGDYFERTMDFGKVKSTSPFFSGSGAKTEAEEELFKAM